MGWLDDLRESVTEYSTAPTLAEMPRNTLADKGIAGPTSAHRIEELHTPLNLAYVTFTTGSTAFQNLVGVTEAELPARREATLRVLSLCGIGPGDDILFTYPPLVSVFPARTLREAGVNWRFLKVSSRDAALLAMAERAPKALVGESSFLRTTLEDAKKLGILDRLPRGMVLLAAGTPLDLELLPAAAEIDAKVHDLYGCQEFGWLALDGTPLREDITLYPARESGMADLLVGGLPTGDRFPLLPQGHLCGGGEIITYSRVRTAPELEVSVLQTTARSAETVERLARTILRIKAKVVRAPSGMRTDADRTLLQVHPYGQKDGLLLEGPDRTGLFDALLQAQLDYQAKAKNDAAWCKTR